jgi:hypothetical protein
LNTEEHLHNKYNDATTAEIVKKLTDEMLKSFGLSQTFLSPVPPLAHKLAHAINATPIKNAATYNEGPYLKHCVFKPAIEFISNTQDIFFRKN